MDKFIFLITVTLSFPIYAMYTTSDELAKESFGAVVLSTNLLDLSEDDCEHVIACAPETIQKHVRLLQNPKTRAALMPDIIIMHGPTGSGKSTLGRVILQEAEAPFLIVKAAMLANEYGNSRAAGIRRIGKMLIEKKGNLMIDEIDRLAIKKQKQDGKEREGSDDAPEALWQLIDDMERNHLLFIGTSNCLENFPVQLQGRFETCLYDIPLIRDIATITEKIVNFHLSGKNIESNEVVTELCKKVNGFSNRQISKLIKYSFLLALERNQNVTVITSKDVAMAFAKLIKDRKFLGKSRWDKKEIFNYTVQTIGAVANIASIINMVLSLSNTRHSLKLTEEGLKNQTDSMNLQREGLNYQNSALQLQEKGVVMQEKALALQERGVTLQEKALNLQETGLEAQKKGLDLQSQALISQQDSAFYQKWFSNPITTVAATIGWLDNETGSYGYWICSGIKRKIFG